MLAVPLKSNMGDILGVLQVINAIDSSGNVMPFTHEDELFASHFARNTTVALQRAQMTRAIILRMIRMAELRDPSETGQHVNRVAGYAVEIYERWAKINGIPGNEMESTRDVLRIAGMLHDVGKVAISDLILKKPGRFENKEYQIMQTHTHIGARLFTDKQSEFDEIASIVALTHHENWDGSGYPGRVNIQTGTLIDDPYGSTSGLKGEAIPLMGRIVALADVFDALSSKRVYKEQWEEDQVLEEIRKLSGIKFDPSLVDVFFEIYGNIKQITQRYPSEA